MQVIETLAEGLKRELKVVIPAADMKARLDERLVDAKDKVRINGFRPGKVPVGHLKKMYGKSIMADLVNELVREKPTEILSSRGEKSATQPAISMTEDEQEAEKILSAESDFEFTVAYEIIPAIELKANDGIKVTREVVEVSEDEINEQILKIAESARTFEAKKGKDVAYPVLHVWVDTKSQNVLKVQEYALSGRLMRTAYYPKWRKVPNPAKGAPVYFPTEIRIYDEVEKGNSTTITLVDVALEKLEAKVFTKSYIESKSR